MEDKCKRCGSPVTSDQAFCQKCGAVIGMSAARKSDDPSSNMAATMVGKNLPSTPSSHRSPTTGQRQAPRLPQQPPPPAQAAKSNTTMLAVIGFVAVLLIGGLLLLLLWLSA